MTTKQVFPKTLFILSLVSLLLVWTPGRQVYALGWGDSDVFSGYEEGLPNVDIGSPYEPDPYDWRSKEYGWTTERTENPETGDVHIHRTHPADKTTGGEVWETDIHKNPKTGTYSETRTRTKPDGSKHIETYQGHVNQQGEVVGPKRKTSETDVSSGGKTHTKRYEDKGRKMSDSFWYPTGHEQTTIYDRGGGSTTTYKDSTGTATTDTTNADGQRTRKETRTDGTVHTWTYDSKTGSMTSHKIERPDGTTTIETYEGPNCDWYARGVGCRKVSETTTDGKTGLKTTKHYDKAGNPIGPSGKVFDRSKLTSPQVNPQSVVGGGGKSPYQMQSQSVGASKQKLQSNVTEGKKENSKIVPRGQYTGKVYQVESASKKQFQTEVKQQYKTKTQAQDVTIGKKEFQTGALPRVKEKTANAPITPRSRTIGQNFQLQSGAVSQPKVQTQAVRQFESKSNPQLWRSPAGSSGAFRAPR